TQTSSISASVTVTALNVPSSLTVTGGGTVNGGGSVTFQVAAGQNAPTGPTSFTVQGTGGNVTHTATVNVTINQSQGTWAFSGPSSVQVFDGQSGSISVSVTGQGGFSGTV